MFILHSSQDSGCSGDLTNLPDPLGVRYMVWPLGFGGSNPLKVPKPGDKGWNEMARAADLAAGWV